ncbi:hypothetical protein L249_6687 [Ophiocordyceps polyrhachis-furcata BCC 54312]|uniref:Bola-like protein n=1 Tax=Ophiocordyceps polyrhachis-furcata BCC 54312 TaxID=1330021 RepID=A0A367LJZ1_9HYPO|nr:hypothetical protein L249_6687 [Ophiocordyceps polyrhachis-furcata BCC 54312]
MRVIMLRCLTAARRPLPLHPPLLLPPICPRRCNGSSAAENQQDMTTAERSVASLLTSKLSPTKLLVQDISGGCGTMYAIHVASPLFRGHSLLKQQRMVNLALGDLVKSWHGLQLRTSVPEDDGADNS